MCLTCEVTQFISLGSLVRNILNQNPIDMVFFYIQLVGWRSHSQKSTKRGQKHLLQLHWSRQQLLHLCATLWILWEDRCRWKVHLTILFSMPSQVIAYSQSLYLIDDQWLVIISVYHSVCTLTQYHGKPIYIRHSVSFVISLILAP